MTIEHLRWLALEGIDSLLRSRLGTREERIALLSLRGIVGGDERLLAQWQQQANWLAELCGEHHGNDLR